MLYRIVEIPRAAGLRDFGVFRVCVTFGDFQAKHRLIVKHWQRMCVTFAGKKTRTDEPPVGRKRSLRVKSDE